MTGRPLRVLIIDDNADLAAIECQHLRAEGHQCESAGTFTDSVETAKHFKPNVVIFDLAMPGDGFTLPALIRQACQPVPIFIAVSGYTDPMARRRLAEDNVFLYLAKPVEPKVLLSLLSWVVI
jgi:CheY-like chemotaxis protein